MKVWWKFGFSEVPEDILPGGGVGYSQYEKGELVFEDKWIRFLWRFYFQTRLYRKPGCDVPENPHGYKHQKCNNPSG